MEARHQKKKGAAAPVCAGCHAATARYACGGCLGNARYCGARCQRRHWPAHERACVAAQQMLHLARHYRATSEKGGIGARTAAGGRVMYAGQPVKRRREGGGDDDDAAMDFEPHQPDDDGSPLFGSDDDDDGGAAAAAGDSDDDASPDAKRARPASWAALERALRLGDLPNELLVEIALAMTPHDLRTFVRAVARIPARPDEGLPARIRSEDAEALLDVVASDTVWIRFLNRDFGRLPAELEEEVNKIGEGRVLDEWEVEERIAYRRYWKAYGLWLRSGLNDPTDKWRAARYADIGRRSARGELPDASIALELSWTPVYAAAATGNVSAITRRADFQLETKRTEERGTWLVYRSLVYVAMVYGISIETTEIALRAGSFAQKMGQAVVDLLSSIDRPSATLLEDAHRKSRGVIAWAVRHPKFDWAAASDVAKHVSAFSRPTRERLDVFERIMVRPDFDPNDGPFQDTLAHGFARKNPLQYPSFEDRLVRIIHFILDHPAFDPIKKDWSTYWVAHVLVVNWLDSSQYGLELFIHSIQRIPLNALLQSQSAFIDFVLTSHYTDSPVNPAVRADARQSAAAAVQRRIKELST